MFLSFLAKVFFIFRTFVLVLGQVFKGLGYVFFKF